MHATTLSEREKEVLSWLAQGKTSWDISIIMGIAERTVNFHACNIMQKLNSVNRAHSVAIAMDMGLISFELPIVAAMTEDADLHNLHEDAI